MVIQKGTPCFSSQVGYNLDHTLMDSEQTPSVSTFLPMALTLMILGWGGLGYLIYYTLPTVGPRWLFYFLIVVAVTGTALPVTAHLNQRFASLPAATAVVVMRQASWFGVYGATLAWLQMGRIFTPPLAILLGVGFGLIEFLLRLSERSRWRP